MAKNMGPTESIESSSATPLIFLPYPLVHMHQLIINLSETRGSTSKRNDPT